MRHSWIILAALALAPAYASAQVAATPPAAGMSNPPAPSGPDTPVSTIPGTTRVPAAPDVNLPLPSVDSSGANRSNESITGEAKSPVGAPRLPGEPMNPPTGPDDN